MPANKVIFIGGVPCTGKTSVSGFVARNLGIDIMLSGDYLREFVRSFIASKKEYETLSVSVYDAWKYFGEMNNDNIIKGYKEQSRLISRGIGALIDRANKNGESLVIESLYFYPDELKQLKENNVISLYIHVSDEERYRKMMMERIQYTHTRSGGDRLVQNIRQYKTIMDYTLRLCKEHGIKAFDNLDYIKTRDEILKYIKDRQ